jgi:hypothetical protein
MLNNLVDEWKIPVITDERLEELLKRISPVVRNSDKNNKLYYIEDVDPKTQAFTWSPTFTKKAKKLVEIGYTFSLHSSYPGLWKPSMQEVLAFIQDIPNIDEVTAVEVTFVEHHQSGNGNIGKVTLYKKEK